MNEEAAFLRAICEHPDDDTPRLVFADWLTEQGGPVNIAWANGIRAQIWQARGDTTVAFAQQSRVFESSYGQARVRERLGVPSQVNLHTWERGFPSEVVGSFQEMRDVWPRLAFRIPIRKLQVYEAHATASAEFVSWPGLSMLRDLIFGLAWESPFPGEALPHLAACAELKGLVALEIQGGSASDSGVLALLDSPHLAGLKTCAVRYGLRANPISPEVLDRFRARFGPDSIFDDEIPF